VEFNKAANGIIGLETALPVVANHLVHKNIISWSKLIELMSLNPARIVGLSKGTLSVGADADIVLIDPNLEKKVDVNLFKSKGRNCPFEGWSLKGWPVKTICGGNIVAG
jgi:dihydroorotase